MGVFDDILTQIPEADRAVLTKYPQLQQSVNKLEQDYQQADRLLSSWETWRKEHFDDKTGMTRNELAAKRQLEEAQMRLTELENGAGTEMTFDEIMTGLRAKGVPTSKEELTKELSGRFVEPESLNKLSAGFEYVYSKTAALPFKHFREFNEDLDMQGLFKYMQEKQVMDPDLAYAQMVEPKRKALAEEADKKRAEETAAQIEAARKEGEEKGRRDAAMGQARTPTDATGASPSLGHLQRQVMQRGAPKTEETAPQNLDYKLGDQRAAQAGYEELLQKRAESVQ